MTQLTLNLQNDLEPTGETGTLSLPVGSRSCANPTQWQESEKVKRMRDISGRRCLEQYGRLNRHGLWGRMFSELLIGMEGWYSTRCRLTWRLKGTKYNRMFFQLVPSTLPTAGTGFGLLPTPQTMDMNEGLGTAAGTVVGNRVVRKSGNDFSIKLCQMGQMGLLPTPKAVEIEENYEDWQKRMKASGNPKNVGKTTCNIGTMAVSGLLPTPRACESIERRNMKTIVDKVENGGDVTLTTLAKYKGGIMLPTPRANESTESVETINNRREKTGSGMMNLTAIARLLPTPATRDYKGARTEESLEESGRNHTNSLPDSFAQLGTTSQLNPRFVAEMMGFPPNWLELPFLNTETNQ